MVAVVVELAAHGDHRAVEALADDAVRRDRADGRAAMRGDELRVLIEYVKLGVEEPVQARPASGRRRRASLALPSTTGFIRRRLWMVNCQPIVADGAAAALPRTNVRPPLSCITATSPTSIRVLL